MLKTIGITHVINIGGGKCHFENSIKYLKIGVADNVESGEELFAILDPSADLIHECLSKNKKVFVHCRGGISRSPSLIIAYLMKYHSMDF